MAKTYSDLIADVRKSISTVTLEEIKRRLDAREPMVLVDVREKEEIREGFIPYVRNISSNFFHAELCISRKNFKLFDMNRSKVVFANGFFRNQNGIFEVVATPRHECHSDVLTERQFPKFSRRTVGKNISSSNILSLLHSGALVDTCILVGTGVFKETINLYTRNRLSIVVLRRTLVHSKYNSRCVYAFDPSWIASNCTNP